jgi:shikimate dehydrogenase
VLTAETRLVALLGHPVAHSLSPHMQNAAFAARGLDWAYVALDVPPERLADVVRGLATAGFAGANVTAPHKLTVAELCDEADTESVNTIVFDDGRVVGTSTAAAVLDGLAFDRPAIVGDGGAARAFKTALPNAHVFSRRAEWPPDVNEADLVVNSTPVRDQVLFELRDGQTLVDLPYPDSATAQAARDRGATVIDGLEVLVRQGAASFERWTGVSAPLDVMRNAVRSAA